jgi:hypothetical protein
MVRLRDGFVSGLPLITLPDRQFDRPISDGPSMAWAETTRAQKLVGSVDRLAPIPYLQAKSRRSTMCYPN